MSDPALSNQPAVLTARDVRKAFQVGDRSIEILHGSHLDLFEGERLCLMGASGAGKSTFLHILGLLEEPTEGEVRIGGKNAWKLPSSERARLRNLHIGFVFQFYHLLPELTAVENVIIPAMIAHAHGDRKMNKAQDKARARDLLIKFGLEQRLDHKPGQLSGGERQRVAVARALFLDPEILIADEPTGNLDTATGEAVLELLLDEQHERKLSLLLVTHDDRLSSRCDRTLYMEDGQIQADTSVVIPH